MDFSERDTMPKHIFLDPENRLYPYKEKVDGEWVVSEEGLRAAISVANMRGDVRISRKASELLKRINLKASEALKRQREENSGDDVMSFDETTALRYKIAKNMYVNEKCECHALEGYAELLKDLTKWGMCTTDSDVKTIISNAIDKVREICSDEKNHRFILQALQNDLDKIAIAPDGMSAALTNIVGMIEESD